MQSQRQTLVQQQRLNLSPQLVQSIKLMALPYADLRDKILEEIEKNPALEIEYDPREAESSWQPETARGDASAAENSSGDNSVDAFADAEGNLGAEGDRIDWRKAQDSPSLSGTQEIFSVAASGEEESDEHRDFIEGVLHHDETLQEHLLAQLGEMALDAKVRALAELVVQNLDGDGFHIVPPEELPGADDPAVLDAALMTVRKLEPAGCATRDFHESLVVQARLLAVGQPLEKDPLLAHTVEVLERHFEALEKGRPDAIAKALQKKDNVGFDVDADEAADILELVRTLDPFPGRAYDRSPGAYIVPDVIVRRREDGFSAEINGEEVPVLRISPLFRELEEGSSILDAGSTPQRGARSGTGKSTASAAETAAREFAREPVREAQWFIHSLRRREETILKVTSAIIDFQREFFMYGPSRLAPLRMKDIAEETGMHEATVSRAANGKYLRCEWGLFELKHFFSNQVGTGRPSAVATAASAYTAGRFSKEGVKEIIRQIIAEGGDALSDQKISDQLAVRGIKVARRTVAKYRGELALGSSFER